MADKKEVAISVKSLHKDFVLPQNKDTSLKQAAINIVRNKNKVTQKVLDGVSFDIYKGEFFGIVGRNGSGKSTLLKILAGVYYPTSGSVEINGGLTPFIELGVGFNPELSGRDNVYLNGALLGYGRKEMDAMYEEIVEFAELGPFMDQKLKNYSSGMQVRLAFSIAIKAKNDILIFDEVLAVGDEAFQKKCMDVFKEYRKNKQTVILVTHSMDNVNSLCTRALMLTDGKIAIEGNVRDVADAYSELNRAPEVKAVSKPAEVSEDVTIRGARPTYHSGEYLDLEIRWPKDSGVYKVGVSVSGEKDEYVFGSNTGSTQLNRTGMNHKLKLDLGPGVYYVNIATYDESGKIYTRPRAAKFSIYDNFDDTVGGSSVLEYKYEKP